MRLSTLAPISRRRLMGAGVAWASTGAAAASAPRQGDIEVWVELSEPALSSVPRDQVAARAAQLRRIAEEQDRTMLRLQRLGAVERARLQTVRNALAVTLPAAALDQARAIVGVRAVRTVQHRNRVQSY
jgi:hypothetical protein